MTKFALQLATTIFFAAASVSADDDANSRLRGGDVSGIPALPVIPSVLASVKTYKDSDGIAHFPTILAGAVAGVTADEYSEEQYPDYCDYEPNYECYKKGVPGCCKGKKKKCPDETPTCDKDQGDNNVPSPTRKYAAPYGYCRADSECGSEYICIEDICQPKTIIGPGNSCRIDSYPCTSGYRCIDDICQAVKKQPGENCNPNLDKCTNKHACIKGICQKNPGKSCKAGRDVCTSGYGCIDGICQVKTAKPLGPDDYCNASKDVCISGYECRAGTCKPAPRIPDRSCSPGLNQCASGFACVDRLCQAAIRPNRSCDPNRDFCTDGYACVSRICQEVGATDVGLGDVCRKIDTCIAGTVCMLGRCAVPPVGPGGYCARGDACVRNYSCVNSQCTYIPQEIPANEPCERGDICVNGYECSNGRCSLRRIPRNEACFPGDVCEDGYICKDEKCSTARWYPDSSWSHCVMDCQSSVSDCCGGTMEDWMKKNSHSTVDGCCSQTAFQGAKDACITQSNNCFEGGIDEQLML